jgi:predicted phage tail protein
VRWRDTSSTDQGFRIERKIGAGRWVTIATVQANTTQFVNLGLRPNTTYRYRVLAFNAVGPSAYSNEATATTYAQSAVPAAPAGLTATAVSRVEIRLEWTDRATNEQGFRIERKIGAGRWVPIATVQANTTQFANVGLTPNTRYRYRVRAFNPAGASAWTTSAAVRTPR